MRIGDMYEYILYIRIIYVTLYALYMCIMHTHIHTPRWNNYTSIKNGLSPKDSHEHKTRKSVLNSITLNFIVTTLIFQEDKLEAEL